MTVPEKVQSASPRIAVAIRECRYGRMMYLTGDIYMSRLLETYGEYSEREASFLASLIQPGDVVADLGAHIGAMSLAFARRVGPTGMVVAFEPQRVLFQLLCANMVMNEQFHVRTVNAAAGAVSESVTLPPLDYSVAYNFGSVSLGASVAGERVPVVPLDALRLSRLALMKVDVEGMEAEALLGAERTIAQNRPILYVENDRRDRSERLIALIAALGYDLWWHLPPMFNPDNFAGATEDIFRCFISINPLCMPKERAMAFPDLRPVAGPSDWWSA